MLSPIYNDGKDNPIPFLFQLHCRHAGSRHYRRRRWRREEVVPKLEVAPLDALAAGVRVDVGLLAEQRKARLLDPVEECGGLEADLDGDPVRLDQELPDVQVGADPVLQSDKQTAVKVCKLGE